MVSSPAIRSVFTPAALAGALCTLLLLAACGEGPVTQPEPPDGWQGAEGRWWQSGLDTAGAFRDLSSLDSMGVLEDITFSTTPGEVSDEQFARAVKRSLLPLYRTDPEVVDSIFERHVASATGNAERTGDVQKDVEAFKSRAYGLMRDHMREPSKTTSMGGEDGIQVTYPDSLRQQDVSGEVRMQVRVDEQGQPVAIELLDGPHPTLNGIAMRATTRMRWEPAAVMDLDGNWQPMPSWTRFNVNFRPPPEQ